MTSAAKLAVLLNPYASRDAVCISSKMHAEYAESTSGLTWQGLSDKNKDKNEGQSFEYSQSQWETLAVAMRGLRRIPLAQRSDAALLARHVTYSAGAELCYGKRGDGSYTSERPSGGCTCSKSGERKCHGPHHWTDVYEGLRCAKAMSTDKYTAAAPPPVSQNTRQRGRGGDGTTSGRD